MVSPVVTPFSPNSLRENPLQEIIRIFGAWRAELLQGVPGVQPLFASKFPSSGKKASQKNALPISSISKGFYYELVVVLACTILPTVALRHALPPTTRNIRTAYSACT